MARQNTTTPQWRIWITTTIITLSLAGVAVYAARHTIMAWYRASLAEPVPTAVNFNQLANSANTNTTATGVGTTNSNNTDDVTVNSNAEPVVAEVIIPAAELNLAVPFTSQAPQANWDLPYQEACEEASVLMAARFLQGRSINGASDADNAIVELVNYNVETLGQPIDTTAEETAHLVEEFYDLETDVLYDWNWDDVKQALTQGYPVIFPAAGRALGNPNFTAPGPIYHMLVIKGYTDNSIITNDPGTRKGADYQYSYSTLERANHDWNDGDVANGAKVIIIVKPSNED